MLRDAQRYSHFADLLMSGKVCGQVQRIHEGREKRECGTAFLTYRHFERSREIFVIGGKTVNVSYSKIGNLFPPMCVQYNESRVSDQNLRF